MKGNSLMLVLSSLSLTTASKTGTGSRRPVHVRGTGIPGRVPFPVLLGLLSLAGCPAPVAQPTGHGSDAPPTAVVEVAEPETREANGDTATPTDASLVALTQDNTKIQFVGIHKGDKPDPRTGTFSKLGGQATLRDGSVQSLHVDIDTDSLTTEIEKLTNHLKSPDFFDVRQHPKATFESTKIEDTGDGKVTITGNLTMLGKTQEITFPATVTTSEGLKLDAEFSIDRTKFGMNFGTDNVGEEVALTIAVTP